MAKVFYIGGRYYNSPGVGEEPPYSQIGRYYITEYSMGGSESLEVPAATFLSDLKKKGFTFTLGSPPIKLSYFGADYNFVGGKVWLGKFKVLGTTVTYQDENGIAIKKEWTPAVDHMFRFGLDSFGYQPDLDDIWSKFPHGFFILMVINGQGYKWFQGVNTDPAGAPSARVVFSDGFQGHWSDNYYYPKGVRKTQTLNLRIDFAGARYAGEEVTLPTPTTHRLYHEVKENTEIIPEHNTELLEDGNVLITTVALNNRDIQTFTVRDDNETIDVKALADANYEFNQTNTDKPVSQSANKISDSEYSYLYHGVFSDLYVSSAASIITEDMDVPEGSTKTKTFSCNDCYRQTYSIVDSNLPTGATAVMNSIGVTGELEVTMPIGAAHEEGFYITVLVEGLNASEEIRVDLTVLDPEWAGTTWISSGSLPYEPIQACEDADGNIYAITVGGRIYKASADLSSWVLCSISGTPTSTDLKDIIATKDYVLVITQKETLKASKGSTSFSVPTGLNISAWYVTRRIEHGGAIPNTNKFYTGLYDSSADVAFWDADTESLLETSSNTSIGANGWCLDVLATSATDAVFLFGGSNDAIIDRTVDNIATEPNPRVLDLTSGTQSGNVEGNLTKNEFDSRLYAAISHNTSTHETDIYKSEDSGATWTFVKTQSNGEDVICWAGNEALALGSTDKTQYSLDGGVSWADSTAVDGRVIDMFRLSAGKLIAFTSGSTNVWISEE